MVDQQHHGRHLLIRKKPVLDERVVRAQVQLVAEADLGGKEGGRSVMMRAGKYGKGDSTQEV